MAAKAKVTSTAPRVGSKVRFRFGIYDVIAIVIEDRGPLGRGGEHIFRVKFEFGGADDPLETEIPVSELTLLTA